MIRVETFSREHLNAIEPQEGPRVSDIPADKISTLEAGWSFTVLDEQSRVLMCAGALPDRRGVWWGWALLSRHASQRMLALTRAILHIHAQHTWRSCAHRCQAGTCRRAQMGRDDGL